MSSTDLQFDGETLDGRMEGSGEFTFPNGVKYVGGFKDGMFHGEGELRFPNGGVHRGKWEDGREVEGAYTFADGLAYEEKEWDYITPADRRFQTERLRGHVWPSGDCQRRNETEEDDDVPEGCYDVGAGMYFDPSDDTIRKRDSRDVVRTPSDEEREWALTKCRQKRPPTGAEAAIALQESAAMSSVGSK